MADLLASLGAGTAAGGALTKFLKLTATGYAVTTPHIAAHNPGTTPLDLRIRMAMDDWTPAADKYSHGIYDAITAANGQYMLYVHTPNGEAVFTWFNPANAQQFAIGAITGIADGSIKWLRVLMTFTTGIAQFFTSDDGSAWTQLGSNVTGLDTTGVRVPGAPAALSTAEDATGAVAGQWTGKVYRTMVIVNSVTISDMDFTLQTLGAQNTTFTATTGETWTISGPAVIANS